MFMMTTHNMPLNYLVDQLKDDVGEVIFLAFSRTSSVFTTR
jgi:hydrogenase 3 maturation protease